jgi:hypothetical protein
MSECYTFLGIGEKRRREKREERRERYIDKKYI